MAEARKLLTAAELDRMTPDQRSAAFRERLVTDLEGAPGRLPPAVEETARRLAVQLEPPCP